jgi:hypothetical protein
MQGITKRLIVISLALVVAIGMLGIAPQRAAAQQAVYNTAFLTDQELEDYNSMDATQIRTFLASQGSYFSQPIPDVDGVTIEVADIIYKASQQYKINPKIILATLEKEHNGITRTTRPTDKQMSFLMGCVTSNTAREQLTCAAERFRSYHNALANGGSSPSGWRVGVGKLTQDGVTVTPATRAVAGQFTYTPYAGVQWGGNQSSVGGVYLFYAAWARFNFGGIVPTPNPQPSPVPLPIGQGRTATALVMDVSGSMGDTWQGGIKIESAKSAAQEILNMISQESQVAGGGHRVGVATFTTDAALLQNLTGDFNQVRMIIGGLNPQATTNLGAGLEVGNTILAQSVPGETKILILLSDGLSNTGLAPDQILAGPVQEAVKAGTCLYTVGFGDPGNLDENLLRQIAAASQTALGCGQYYYANDVISLESTYIRIRHQSIGNIIGQFTGNVAQGQTVQAGSVNVPPGQEELAISLHWPGSKMELVLHDPTGKVIQSGDPNLRLTNYANLVYALVLQPIPGNWLIDVLGAQISQPNEPFDVLVSAQPAPITPTPTPTSTPPPIKLPTPKGSGFETTLFILLLGGGGVALYVYITVLRRRREVGKATSDGSFRAGSLYILNGPLSGKEIPLQNGSTSIGRSTTNQVVLPDKAVSRLHATLRYGQGNWFVQDQHSRSGTFVNGQRVSATRLTNGDRLLFGATEIVFKLNR